MKGKASTIVLVLVVLVAAVLFVSRGPEEVAVAGSLRPERNGAALRSAGSYYLDQAQQATNYGFWFEQTVIRWQEFKPSHTSLARLDLYIGKNGSPGNVRVSVQDPAGAVLWETTVLESDVVGYGWVEILVDPAIPLQPNDSYYIYVWSDADSPSPDDRYFWRGQTSSSYERGISSVESAWPGYDFAFRTWSTGGNHIIYHADRGAGIWRMNADGSGNIQLSDHGWFAEYSPDNTKIAFGEYYNGGIWVMNADGTNQQRLTQSGSAPTWSPDGTQIAYHDGDTQGTTRRIWVMDADGTNAQQISGNPGSFPKWSPNGTQIAYHGEVNNGIWLINPDGTGETRLYAGGGYPTWSPDGSKMAYVSLSDWFIWTMNADGTGRTPLTNHTGIQPDWRPDWTQIAYEDLNANNGIWVINADGTNDQLINQAGHAPDWSAQAATLNEPDLIVQTIAGPASACIGESLGRRITFVVQNVGSGDAVATDGYFHTDLVLSSDAVIGNTDDILLIGGRDQVYDVLAPGQLHQVSLAGSNAIPAGTPPGLYYLGAIVDAVDNHVAESDEENNVGYYYPIEVQACRANAFMSLHIEDALEGVAVNKVVGDPTGPTFYTRLEIVAKLFTLDATAKDDVSVILSIPNDLFGNPVDTWVRTTSGGVKSTVGYTNLGGGQYKVTTDLSLHCTGIFCGYRKQIVWRFLIPNDTLPQLVNVQAELRVPDRTVPDPHATGVIRILEPGSVRAIIVANRKLLYDHYVEGEVNSLLARLFTEAAGHPLSHSPLSVIYYVERYDARAYNWDNSAVNYASDATANEAADAIDDLIEDWYEDATEYTLIYIPFIGYIPIPVSWPNYLMIVGDDDTIPFYRYNDPSNDEGINTISWCPTAQGWCVDSATNPAVHATDEDYFFTDNPYADLAGGTDWQTGDIELWVGRLLGASAADMLSLLEQGVSWANGQRGSVVMASVDGWELGLEPDPGGAGHIVDLYDVPALFRGKGFQVRNDDVPATEVRTIDVMSPFEGGNNSWNNNFRNAANNAGGMDLFFIGGHNSYDYASIPGDDFSPDDTCAAATCRYNRFDNDHPIAMIVGCHGGLPVPDVDVNGGVDDDMVYDLVHEGVSAFIGATGFSYGSPNNLHSCTWGERLMQHFFHRLLLPPGGNAMAIGKAMAEAKSDYVFAFGGNDALDRKTVTEFNLYGVPWSFIYYPSTSLAAQATQRAEPQAFTARSGQVMRVTDSGVYSRTFEVDIMTYTIATETQAGIVYDLFSVDGGRLAIADDAPILPYIEGYGVTLPFSATLSAVQVLDVVSSSIGTYNVPIAQVMPWTEGGVTYTTTTEIDYPYPTDLVQYQETGEGLLFTLFPIQHNPTTNETTFYSHFEIRVVYEAPLPIAVLDFSMDKMSYRPGETLQTTTIIENVGDVPVPLTAMLTIKDELGGTLGVQPSGVFTVPAGSSYELPLAWTGTLQGARQAAVTLWSDGGIVGGASTGFEVVLGEILAFDVPEVILPNVETTLALTFANYRPEEINATISVAIYDWENGLVGYFSPQTITVGAGASETVSVSGNLTGMSGETYTAVALVTVDDLPPWMSSASFEMGSSIYLPAILKNF